MLKGLTTAAFIAFLLTSAAVAGPFEDGVEALNRGDFASAAQLWKQSAEQGNIAAQYNLGLMYDIGQGLPQNDVEAIRWYRLAAEQGHSDAQYNLGVMYAKGDGVPQDYREAVRWYRLSAEQGYSIAQFNLGVRYAKGEGVPQDYIYAHAWFNLAASQGDQDAAKARASIANRMTPEQIAEAQRLAREWLPKN